MIFFAAAVATAAGSPSVSVSLGCAFFCSNTKKKLSPDCNRCQRYRIDFYRFQRHAFNPVNDFSRLVAACVPLLNAVILYNMRLQITYVNLHSGAAQRPRVIFFHTCMYILHRTLQVALHSVALVTPAATFGQGFCLEQTEKWTPLRLAHFSSSVVWNCTVTPNWKWKSFGWLMVWFATQPSQWQFLGDSIFWLHIRLYCRIALAIVAHAIGHEVFWIPNYFVFLELLFVIMTIIRRNSMWPIVGVIIGLIIIIFW